MSNPIEIVFNFDTTGSMYPCIGAVRKNVEQVIGNLFKEIPNLKVGVGANGDYQDAASTYLTKTVDLTNDLYSLTSFVRNVERTHGYDGPEAYEVVLNEALNYSWSLNSKKIFVLIGDAIPHEPDYPLNKNRLDWRVEAQKLADKGIEIYSVQCLGRNSCTPFWKKISEIGNGFHLELDQFYDIEQLVQGIVYKQVSKESLENFEQKIIKSGKMNRSLDDSFAKLLGRPRDAKGRFVAYKDVADTGEELVPVSSGRFQILDVSKDSVIRDFVGEHDLLFAPGRGFYEFTKRETIQDKKEIVIRNKVTGDMFSGSAARKLLGIPFGMGKSKISPKHGDKYDVFVQSTSYNRKLVGGTRFLYETTDDSK